MGHNTRAEDTYLQIGEAADRTELTQRTLRYYEEKGLLHPPTRMEGGFRLYSPEDFERLERIKELKTLLGFSLADIKEMLEADDVRTQIRAQWDRDADAAEKAARIRTAREATVQQLALIEQKALRMAAMRDELHARLDKYDALLSQWSESNAGRAAAAVAR